MDWKQKITEELAKVIFEGEKGVNSQKTLTECQEEAKSVMMYYTEIKTAEYRCSLFV